MHQPEATLETQVQTRRDDTVRCRECAHAVTRQRAARENFEHTFRNPHGYSFHVLCYSEAPGCLSEGTPTLTATWFPGFAWALGMCEGCGGHLGWWFSGSRDHFAGLIATRLLRPLE